ncbi:hypothetical protein [Burkholderia orbicola]|uniref:hypothetical protein n=1 Tax=Burkholderia orbicola TaxID=2978683 RepID=UPI002FE1E67A
MSEILVYCAVASTVVVVGGTGYWFSRVRSKAAFRRNLAPDVKAIGDITPLSTAISEQSLSESPVFGINLDFIDSTGNVVFNTRELPRFPSDAVILDDTHGVALARGRQLAADVFKGSLGLPNKTVEIVFDPDIQRKLAEGTLEVVPAIGGGTRAMARRVDNGQIAAHGRVLEGGRVRQMAAGAFQLLSIAVAQSHLDDISRNLISIKNEIAGIREQLHINAKSRLTGTVDYLSRVVALYSTASRRISFSIVFIWTPPACQGLLLCRTDTGCGFISGPCRPKPAGPNGIRYSCLIFATDHDVRKTIQV